MARLPVVDETIRRILSQWSRTSDRQRACRELGEAYAALSEPRRAILRARMAEVALGFLAVIDDTDDD